MLFGGHLLMFHVIPTLYIDSLGIRNKTT
jgi:hypothetical protein